MASTRTANIVGARSAADPVALRIAYETGRINGGGGSLGAIPDHRLAAVSRIPLATSTDSFRSFVTRARLVAANGRADNHVILRAPGDRRGPGAPVPVNPIQMMDRWLAAIGNDRSPDAPAVKVARNRPADVADACFTEQGERIVEPASYTSQGRCNQLYPPHADPRIAAGAPLTNDILKCELKPIEATDYPLPFTTAQWCD